MSNESDIRAIEELRAMARVYANHGFEEKAEQLLNLAEAMESRMRRTANPLQIVSINKFRADQAAAAENEEDSNEQAN